MRKNSFFALALFAVLFLLDSCATFSVHEHCSRMLAFSGSKNEDALVRFFRSHNKSVSKRKIKNMARLYIREADDEGINSDVAFVQMCLETGFLRFGNLVKPEMNNFCGLGAMDEEHPGIYFDSMEEGIRAHIQHLHAYATNEEVPLKNELIDPRYTWVHKTKYACDVFELAGQWAADKDYGLKLDRLLSELEGF